MSRKHRNTAKLMARLNPKSLNLRGSGGGIPEITTEEIAAALGMAGGAPGPRLAVLVVALRWWPGLMDGPCKVVGHREIHHHGKQTTVKDGKRVTVRTSHKEQLSIEAPAETASFVFVADVITTRLLIRIQKAHRPKSLPRERGDIRIDMPDDLFARFAHTFKDAGNWARVVIAEYRHPNHCPTCTAFSAAGQVPVGLNEEGVPAGCSEKIASFRWQTCLDCAGAGVQPWGSARRAKALGMRRETFVHHLAQHHEAALTFLREMEWRGIRRIKGAL